MRQTSAAPRTGTAWPATVLLGLLAAYQGAYLFSVAVHGGAYPFGDFFALWSYARVPAEHPAALLYDIPGLHAAQVALGMPENDWNPFPYPPSFILLLSPLRYLDYPVAWGVWMVATLGLYAASLRSGRHAALLLAAALFAPTTTVTMVAGQGGLLAAGLLIGGARLVGRAPVVAGVAFGLLTYKPQFGLLAPVALVAAGQWRCIASAAVTAGGLGAAAALLFGPGIWADWLASLGDYQAMFEGSTDTHHLMATVMNDMEGLGATPWLGGLMQVLAAGVAAGLVWVSWRRGKRDLAVVVLLAATCLATPHAFLYDLPILTGTGLLFVDLRLGSGRGFTGFERGTLGLVLLSPVVVLASAGRLPVTTVGIGLLLACVWKEWRQATSGARSAAARAQAAPASSSNSSASFFITVPPSSSASTMVTARR